MKCKLKALFIGISISIMIGNLFPNVFGSPEFGETFFETRAENTYCYNDIQILKEDSYSEYSDPLRGNLAYTSRLVPKNKRLNPSSSSKNGLMHLQRKEHKDYYNSPIYPQFTRRSSSSLNEARKQLISFGRLII